MVRIKINLFPKEGYFFKEVDGSIQRARSWAGVIARVKEYRKRNGMPPGDPENEVHAQACQRNPNLCIQESPQQKQQKKVVSVKGRVLAWLSALVASDEKEPLEFVAADQAKQRADICARCPRNAPLADGCSSCKAAVREYRGAILKDKPQDSRIQACVELGEDTVVSSWLDSHRVDKPELPAECWRKKIV